MEKLQIALEKARASRAQTAQEAVSGATPPAEGASVAPDQAPATPAAPDQPLDAQDELWGAFPSLEIDKRQMEASRLLSYEGGKLAAPFDILRTKLVRAAQAEKWRRIAVVSPGAGAGKTTTLVNLAFSLGRQSDLRTIALDFDLRRPALHRVLGQKPKQGMADVIYGRIGFDQHGRRLNRNLVFGMNDQPARNSSEILQSHQTATLLTALEDTLDPDYMLFDMPPMLLTDDSYGFLSHVDAALIVVEAERTPMAQVDVVERQVAEVTNVLGVVLNKCNYSDDAHSDSYGYY